MHARDDCDNGELAFSQPTDASDVERVGFEDSLTSGMTATHGSACGMPSLSGSRHLWFKRPPRTLVGLRPVESHSSAHGVSAVRRAASGVPIVIGRSSWGQQPILVEPTPKNLRSRGLVKRHGATGLHTAGSQPPKAHK